jgi:hypothetical protein
MKASSRQIDVTTGSAAFKSSLACGLIDLRLLFELLYRPDVYDPWLRGARPYLYKRDNLVALTNRTYTYGVDLGACSGRRGVDWRPTFRAKRLRSLVSAFAGLDVDFRFAREQPESALPSEGVHAKCGAGECLAVGAIADEGLLRLDLGFEGDVSAVTTPVDFHLVLRNAFLVTRR